MSRVKQILKNETVFENVRLAYVAVLMVYSIARQMIVPLQPFFIHSAYNYLAMGLAIMIFLWDLSCFRNVLRARYLWILVGMFACTLIVSAMNFRYALMDNIKAAANMFIQFFVLYAVNRDASAQRLKRDVRVISKVLCIFWFVAALVSVMMYFLDISYTQTNYIWGDSKAVWQGFVREDDGVRVMRLWGIFLDPNFAAAYSIVAMILSVWLLREKSGKVQRVCHIINIFVQFLYIVLSGSRMAWLILVMILAFGLWYLAGDILKRWQKTATFCRLYKELLALVLAVASIGVAYGARSVAKTLLPYVPMGISYVKEAVHTQPTVPPMDGTEGVTTPPAEGTTTPPDSEETTGGKENYELEREDIYIKKDESNGRLDMWREGFRILEQKPILGVGPRSYTQVAAELDSKMIIAKKSIHNSYMELLMGNGILGFLLMLVFFVLCAWRGLKQRLWNFDVSADAGFLLLSVLSMLITGMFISSLFYYLTGISVITFTLLGYAMAMLEEKR